jgi:hypothetical protein
MASKKQGTSASADSANDFVPDDETVRNLSWRKKLNLRAGARIRVYVEVRNSIASRLS